MEHIINFIIRENILHYAIVFIALCIGIVWSYIMINLGLAMNHKKDTIANRFLFNLKKLILYIKSFKLLKFSKLQRERFKYRKRLLSAGYQRHLVKFADKNYPDKYEIRRTNKLKFVHTIDKIQNLDYIEMIGHNRDILKSTIVFQHDDGINHLTLTHKDVEGIYEFIGKIVMGVISMAIRKT